MTFRDMLLRGAFPVYAPEDDRGAAVHEEPDEALDLDESGADEGFDDADDRESADDGAPDRGEDDDDGEGAGQAGQPVETEVRRPTRAQARVETALREAREAKEELARIRAERDSERNRVDHSAAQAARQQRLDAMDPYERQNFLTEERAREQDARIARIEFNSMDAADRTDFAAKCAREPALAVVADQVEAELKRIRANGNNTDRDTIATYLLGKRARERGAAAATRQSKKGAARIDAQRARPTGGRSDTRAETARGDSQAARRARLEGIQL